MTIPSTTFCKKKKYAFLGVLTCGTWGLEATAQWSSEPKELNDNFEEPWIKEYLNTCVLKWAGPILVANYHFPLGTPTKTTGVYLILCPWNLDAKHPIAMAEKFPVGKFSTKFFEIWCGRLTHGWEWTCCGRDSLKCKFLYQVISSINVIKCYGWEEPLPKCQKHSWPLQIW